VGWKKAAIKLCAVVGIKKQPSFHHDTQLEVVLLCSTQHFLTSKKRRSCFLKLSSNQPLEGIAVAMGIFIILHHKKLSSNPPAQWANWKTLVIFFLIENKQQSTCTTSGIALLL